MGSLVVGILIVPIVIPGYKIGSWRWLRRTRSYYEIMVVLAVFLFAWYGVLRLAGGSEVLVPFAMFALVGGYGAGRVSHDRRRRAQ